MCLFDLEVGAVYVAVWSVVKDDPLKLRSYFTQGRLLAKSGGSEIEMTSREVDRRQRHFTYLSPLSSDTEIVYTSILLE
jgi:hypothetical protein